MDLTTRNRERLGGVAIHKGKNGKDETPIVLWDAVPKCVPEECIIEDRCPYSKGGHCTLRVNYQKHVVDMVLGSLETVTEEQMLKIGMHLIPLYTQLIAMKMEALAAPTMVVSRGSIVPNPLFKEIRSVIKDITFVLSDIGINGGALKGGGIPDKPERGNRSYYDKLMEL